MGVGACTYVQVSMCTPVFGTFNGKQNCKISVVAYDSYLIMHEYM